MLLNQAEASELGCRNTGVEVNVVIARNVGLGAGNPALNPCFNFGGSWH
jgi:hypothetical protein